jgi:predicted NAD-dependent protein-ADP-ribosyltransferase YbiA (DUF1768 family)
MFVLPHNASKVFLAKRETRMNCKAPDFEALDFKLSSCGTFKYHLSDNKKLLVAVVPESTPGANDGVMLYAFFKRDFSNFSEVKAVEVVCEDDEVRQALLNPDINCPEQLFKTLCAILHLHEKTDENLNVMQAVLNAEDPPTAKKATNDIKGFNKPLWDREAPEAMCYARRYSNRDPLYRDRNLYIGRIAKEHGVLPENVFFAEATEMTPAVEGAPATETTPEIKAKKARPADKIWGTGCGGVEGLWKYISENNGFPKEFIEYLKGPIDPSGQEVCLAINGECLGKNQLGKVMKTVFMETVGSNYEYLHTEDMDGYIARMMREGLFDCVTISEDSEPEQAVKRSRTCSDD